MSRRTGPETRANPPNALQEAVRSGSANLQQQTDRMVFGRFGDYTDRWVVDRLRWRLWYYFVARFVCASSVPIDLASVIWIIEFGRGFMAAIDLGGIKIRFARNYAFATPDGPLYVSWTLIIGLAMPSFRLFPMAWNLLALDRVSEGKMTINFLRLGVSDDDGAASE
ncbi:MAG: hypothetical protein ABSF25_19500 [Bryobacteraceae bacterium]|jgi:hypothetical protein